MSLSCFKECGGTIKYPFIMTQDLLLGKNYVCFGNCMNINLENGPYLSELGNLSEDDIPKKFIWS